MGGGKSGVSDTVQKGELAIAQQEMGNAQSLYNTSFPGFKSAEDHYQQMASGDPTAISRAISPAAQQINAQATATNQRIDQDMPRGGAKNLAKEETEINKGAQIGQAATQGYLGAFQNLAGLAGQGIGQSNQLNSQAGSQFSTIANQQAEGKAQELGFYSSLAGTAAEAAGACWIAEALFGEFAIETLMVRRYLLSYAVHHWFGRRCVNLYLLYGRSVAAKIKVSRVWRALFMPLFRWLFGKAQRVLPDTEQRRLFEEYWDHVRPRRKA